MPSKRRSAASLEQGVDNGVKQTDGPIVKEAPKIDEIERRAYEIYLERGSSHGRAMDDWLQAEQELKRDVS